MQYFVLNGLLPSKKIHTKFRFIRYSKCIMNCKQAVVYGPQATSHDIAVGATYNITLDSNIKVILLRKGYWIFLGEMNSVML